jgi:hypothetical protein
MSDQPAKANQLEIRQALRELVSEVASNIAKQAGNPRLLLDLAADLEGTARNLRTQYRRHSGK